MRCDFDKMFPDEYFKFQSLLGFLMRCDLFVRVRLPSA